MPDKSKIKEALNGSMTGKVSATPIIDGLSHAFAVAAPALRERHGENDLVKVIIKDWRLSGDVKSGYNVHMLVEVMETGEEKKALIKRKMFIKESEFNDHMENAKPFYLRKEFLID